MKTYRAAIVGLTNIGARPLPPEPVHPALGFAWPHSHASAYALLPNVEVAAVCDLRTEPLEQFRTSFHEQWPDVHLYTDYREMLAGEGIDLLSVVTSDHRHAQIVVDAAEAGVRGIFCEKPIATSLADADRMIEACERKGVVMSINHSRRLRPHWHAAKAQVGDGPLGEVRRIVGSQVGERAMLFGNGTHLIDAICWFAGGEPEWVMGVLDEDHRDYGPRYAAGWDIGERRDVDRDPGGSGLVQFDNGVQAFINCASRTQATLELQVFAEHGRVVVDNVSAEVWTSTLTEGPRRQTLSVPLTRISEMPDGIADLIESIEQGREVLSPPREARKALTIILAMLQSHTNGNTPVRFPISDA